MPINNRFREIFPKKAIIGMIHLAGYDPVKRALDELEVFQEEGIDAAIIENYHGSEQDVYYAVHEIAKRKYDLVLGINVLPNNFFQSIPLAAENGFDYVQLDHVAGGYNGTPRNHETLNVESYVNCKRKHPEIIVMGGVWPKYYTPIKDSKLEDDLYAAKQRAEAIVVTGQGTGMETPLSKIVKFKNLLKGYPLIIGAGVTPENAHQQLKHADGAIVGSSLKVNNNTKNELDRKKIRDLMKEVKQARKSV